MIEVCMLVLTGATREKNRDSGKKNTHTHTHTRTHTQKKLTRMGGNTGVISVNRTRKKEITQGESQRIAEGWGVTHTHTHTHTHTLKQTHAHSNTLTHTQTHTHTHSHTHEGGITQGESQ